MRSIATVGLLVLVIGPARAEDDPKKAEKSLGGDWSLVTFQPGEVIVDLEAQSGVPVSIVTFGPAGELKSKKLKSLNMTFILDSTAKLKTIDLSPADNKRDAIVTETVSRKGIYKLEGDRLTICYAVSGERPTKFEASKTTHLLVLDRAKK